MCHGISGLDPIFMVDPDQLTALKEPYHAKMRYYPKPDDFFPEVEDGSSVGDRLRKAQVSAIG
jgi:hypothetical protein